MSILFYLILGVLLLVCFGSIIEIILLKNELKNLSISVNTIINMDTNKLITVGLKDKELKSLASCLNMKLKELRKLELEYKNGSGELKASITNISHDLRTPLTSIKGYLDLMDKNKLNNKQKKYLKIIDDKVDDLVELTDRLFEFSKSLDLREDLRVDDVSINDVLEDTLAGFYSLFKKNNITPNIDICKEKIIKPLNESVLKRIFENIISNAIKYGEVDFNVRLDSDGLITFSNKTDKMDSTRVEKIFNRYYTVSSAKKSNGVGLSIAKQLVESMNGRIIAKYSDGYLIIKVKF